MREIMTSFKRMLMTLKMNESTLNQCAHLEKCFMNSTFKESCSIAHLHDDVI